MTSETIQVRTAECQQLFAQCVSLRYFEPKAWLEMRRGEFNLWAYGLQALSTGKSSLDYRVRNRMDVRDILLALICGLSEDLKDCLKIDSDLSLRPTHDGVLLEPGDQDAADFDFVEFSDDEADVDFQATDSEQGPFSSQMFNIRLTLAQLTRFSSMIRRSGTKFRFERADSSLDLDESELKELNEHLTTMILIRSMKSDAVNPTIDAFQAQTVHHLLTPIQKRLVHANLLRRNRILEATKKMRSEEQTDSLEPLTFAAPVAPIATSTSIPAPQAEAQSKTGVTIKSSAQTARESNTKSATEIGSQLGPQLTAPKAVPSVMTRVTETAATQDYPKCPKPISDNFIRCPYCSDMLPIAYSHDRARWRGHVAQDILPYMCIYEECPLPDEMYLTSEELISHARTHHGKTMWTCSHCLPEAGEDIVFDSSIKWQDHMRQAHQDLVPVDQLPSLAGVCECQVIQAASCPLCEFSPVGMQTTVDQHIIQHLHEFSLRSLPQGAGNDAEASISGGSVSGSAIARLDELDEDEQSDWQFDIQSVEFDCEILHRLGSHITVDSRIPVEEQAVLQRWQRCMDATSSLAHHEHELRQQYPRMLTRIRTMIRQADLFLSSLSVDKLSHSSELDLDRNFLQPLHTEIDILNGLRTAGNHSSPKSHAQTRRFDFGLPPTPTRLVLNEKVNSHLRDFALGKTNGFAALVTGDIFGGRSHQGCHFAQEYLESFEVFWVDMEALISHHPKTIGDLDRVFGQIAADLLPMSDLLGFVTDEVRGSAFVETMLLMMNAKTAVEWLIIINNLTIPPEEFLRHDQADRGFIQFPEVAKQGTMMITSMEQPEPARVLQMHWISHASEKQQGIYAAPDGDFEFDNVLSPAELARLRIVDMTRPDPQGHLTGRGRPTLNLVHPTPPSSPSPAHVRMRHYEYISSYNLSLSSLEAYLSSVFPGPPITLATRDRYVAQLPQALSSLNQAEINRLRRRR